MSFNGSLSAKSCPPQPWPAGLPPCPDKRIGLTDPLTPHAAHPARFQQLQQQRTALAVYNPNDPGGEASLASLAAQEQARRRLFVSSSQSCGAGLNHVLVTLNSTQADALRDTGDAQAKHGAEAANAANATAFNVRLETPMTDMLSNRFVYGQLRSWEVDLLQRCASDPQRALALVRAPVNNEPVFGEEHYSLPISEVYPVTQERQLLHLPIAGGRCPQALLPLTTTHIERAVAFRWWRDDSSARRMRCDDNSDGALPLYAFRTCEEHGYAPGLRLTLVVPSKVDDDPYEPDNADEFVVVDAGSATATPGASGAAVLGVNEFVALRCRRVECAAREARVFEPWDVSGSECRKYGCEATAPRIDAPLPNHALGFLRYGRARRSDRHSEDECCDDLFWARDFLEEDVAAFGYVAPATSPVQLADLVNGALRAQRYCGCDAFDEIGVQVRYDNTIDQFIAVDARGSRTPLRSLFGDECGASATLNFPLQRSSMVASECALDYKQIYLERALTHFHYFDVNEGVNDRFFVRLEGESDESKWRAVTLPPACYAARFFAAALEVALNDAYDESTPLFAVRYELFDTDALLEARAQHQRQGSGAAARAPRAGPYTNLTFAIVIELRDVNGAFSLAFGQDERSVAFANLIDFEPRETYELRTLYASRALSLDCADERVQRKWILSVESQCGVQCAPCPRRRYEARVEPAHGLVTLQQRIQRPFEVCKTDRNADGSALSVRVVGAAERDPAVLFCAGDVLIASRTNPLGARACCGEEVLVVIVGERAFDEFDLSSDPLPDADRFWLWSMPVGFNVHLHSEEPPNTSTFNYFDADKSQVSQRVASSNAVTRYLGFRAPTTRSGSYCYTSDQSPASILDETLLIRVPELLPLATSESRDTLYTPQSPFDRSMTQYYAQLLLDRATGMYRAFPALVAPLPELSAPRDVLPAAGASGVPCLQRMTVQLYRADGSPYYSHGNPFTLTFELVFVRK